MRATLRAIVVRLLGLFNPRTADSRMDEDIQAHIDLLTQEHLRHGMSLDEARLAARRSFGGLVVTTELYRDQYGFRLVDELAQDVRYTARALRRSAGFAWTAILILALGIGATTAIFSVVDSVLIRPLVYPDSDRLVRIVHEIGGADQTYFSDEIFVAYLENARAFQDLGVWVPAGRANVTGQGEPEEVRALAASRGVLTTLGVQPAVGRWFSEKDDAPGAADSVMLTHGYWLRKFGGDRHIVGRVLNIDARPHEIVGVMPPQFSFRGEQDIIRPLKIDRGRFVPGFRLNGIARLKPGVTLAQANADVARLFPIWIRNPAVQARWAPALRPLKQDVIGDVADMLWVLLATIGIVLLMACANVASLLLVRAEARHHEFAIRAALGASWTRLARARLVESVTLALLGGVLGIAVAYGGLRVLVAMGPPNLPRLAEISIDPMALGLSLLVSLLSGLLLALIPIFRYTRPRLTTRLGSGSRSLTKTRDRSRSQHMLVALQIALAVILLVSAGLMIRSFLALRTVDAGVISPQDVQSFTISIPPREIAEPERVTRLQHEIVEKIAGIPGVGAAAFTTRLPMDQTDRQSAAITAQDKVETRPSPPNRHVRFVSPGMFQTLGTPLVAGRDFTWTDLYDSREVTIVSENLAREIWGAPEAALGRRIREFYSNNAPWREIVGVAGNVHDDGAHQAPPATVYWPAQVRGRTFGVTGYQPRRVTVAFRSERAGTESLIEEIADAVRSVNPNLPLAQVRTLGDIYDESMARTSFTLVLLAIAGTMALLLAISGVYGVIAYAVSQQRREIGIRLALGAQTREIRALFFRRALVLVTVGVAIGLGGAAVSTRLMQSLLFGIDPVDTIAFTAMPFALAATALLASYLSTRRAVAIDPAETLRAE